ncbi:glycerophosphoryl diester phosphodiesterase [Staphylococcus auricularis]|uniref:Glycerophosphodiester phosphodiesterase n=1 Tax=Staphylococcus auricularis TaxID=29379 RepID=A0AAP8PNQ2_9STAP|nr:glycerophosphodiester phosphodiesterase family protein [Staphylococcus auricularis]PNZ67303.1 glycerophosphodiester phosphodiesterase [Staphylococcus auricularis]QPT06968.1 glycerophosphodiester phosphodiesterase [Staphylococcus auricularis]BCU52571.1 glycerophosphoryl diester phosphodiesterase [Staphylococcus auricularis]SQJ12630.1 glycerophosphoryl diester phosphodiesterase [Staphylococcus auricularis]
MSKNYTVIAHRGLSGRYPENTMPAFQAAIDLGVERVEIDLHMTKDQQLVVMHDDSVNRTSNGSGKIKDFTLEELKQLDVGSWKDQRFEGEHIPTFEEVLELFKHRPEALLIELKKPRQYPGIEKAVLAALDRHHYQRSQAIIQSFDIKSMQLMAASQQTYPIGVLISKKLFWNRQPRFKDIANFADYVNPNYELVTHSFVSRAHDAHLTVYPYTVNSTGTEKHLRELGVDGVISDVPEQLDSWTHIEA